MKIRELVNDDRQNWNEFVGKNPHGDVLQAWEWGDVKAAGGSWKAIRYAAFDDNGDIEAGVAFLARKIPLVGTLYYAPRGPLMNDWSKRELLRALMESVRTHARADRAALLKIDPSVPGDVPHIEEMLGGLGFRRPADQDAQGFGGTQPKAVMVLDIGGKSDDDLMAGFKAQCRRNVRIAERKGVEVISETTREEHLEPFYELLKITAERDGFRVRAYSYYEALWANLVEKGLGKLFITRYEGVYLSGAICFVIGDKCCYVYGASSNEHRNVMPNYAMQWSMIRWARDLGCSIYDFRGVSPVKPSETPAGDQPEGATGSPSDHLLGLNRFKEGFGARLVEYVGEFDLPLNGRAYWMWTRAKPAAQDLMKRVRSAR